MGVLPEEEFTLADYIGAGVTIGLSVKETLQIPVGLLLDLWELYLNQHGIKKNKQPDL